MSRSRRFCVVLAGLGFLTTLAGAQEIRKALPFPPPPVGAPAAPAPAPAKASEFSDALNLPTDNDLKQVIEAAEDRVKEKLWAEAARLLQSLLDSKEDVFIEVRRKEKDGKEGVRKVSVRAEASRLIGQLPPEGLENYELLYGPPSKARLNEAKTKSDPRILAEVAQRYLHTEAGAEATNLLGTYHLDRGNFVMAALCFERLISREAAKVTPLNLFKATLAYHRIGDQKNGERAWSQLVQKVRSDNGLRFGDQLVTLDRLRQHVDKVALPPADPYDWSIYRGNASRTAQGTGGAPFLEPAYQLPTAENDDAKRLLAAAMKYLEDRNMPILSAFFPIAAGGKLLYRSYWGIHAIDLKTGDLAWKSKSSLGLDVLMADRTGKMQAIQSWLGSYQQSGRQSLLFENSTLGTLSTDNQRVYVIDDLALPPPPNQGQFDLNNQYIPNNQFGALAFQNRLQAIDLESGKLLWELNGKGDTSDLSDSYFLGAPLPMGGKLYVLNEKNSELRLVCLDAAKGDVTWTQKLGDTRDKITQDIGRRVHAANLAYGEGMLVCPTNAGAILGVDLLTHSLVWSRPYREGSAQPEERLPMNRFGRFAPGANWIGPSGPNPNTDWKVSAPAIQDGKVVFTAPDGASIHCLNLRDGEPLWKASRDDDLYLAGVFSGKVLLVGKTTCRALNLADGKLLWRLETGMPSGQGVASKNVYYLPLKKPEPQVCAIDINKGEILGRTKSRKKADGSFEIPGNLVFYEGTVLSQTATTVTAYPQLEVKLAEMKERIAKNPKDPKGLTERGELLLYQGKLQDALADLRTAMANNPSADVLPKTRAKLFETMTELLQRDFDANEKYLDEYTELCKVDIKPDAPEDVRKKLEEEGRRREGDRLFLVAKGRERQGRLVDAFEAYMKFGTLVSNRELRSVLDEPAVKTRPDVWAQGRIAAMVAKATPEQRLPLEAKIAAEWQAVQESPDPETLPRFAAMFGSLFRVGKEALLQLAERRIAENDQQNFLETELHLLQLRNQEDPQIAARAVEAQARLLTRKGLLEDAAACYRELGGKYEQVVVRDGKTGADFFNELATDKRFLAYLDPPGHPWANGRVRAKQERGNFNQVVQIYSLEPEGELLPFFQRHRLALNLNYFQLKLIDRTTGADHCSKNLAMDQYSQNLVRNYMYQFGGYSPTGGSRYPYHVKGHLVVVNVGHMIYAFDPVAQKILWERNLFGLGHLNVGNPQIIRDRDGSVEVIYQDGWRQKLGQTGPVGASYVCLHTREGLVALDPVRGTELWTKSDVPARAQSFGDDQHVYLVEVRPDGSISGSRAMRARDGVTVEVPDFAALYQRKLRVLGRHLLLSETEPQGGLALRLYDVHTGSDVWRRSFAANAVVLRVEDPYLAGAVEPDGTVTVVDLRSRQEVLQTAVDPDHLRKVQEVLLLQDSDQFFLAINGGTEVNVNNPWGGAGPWQNVSNGIRWAAVNGKVYAFDRATGKVRWINDVPTQTLVLDQFKDMPFLLFTAQYNKAVNQGQNRLPPRRYSATKSIDKRTGKLLFDEEMANDGNQFYALNTNLREGKIELVSYNLKVTHYLASEAEANALGQRSVLPPPAPDDGRTAPGRVIIRAAPPR
jgi:outer membrane protein assembly factor BamB